MLHDDINFSDIDDDDDNWVSKSSVKRYGKHLRDIGAQIIALSHSEELRRELLHIESLLRNREDYIKQYEDALKAIASTMVAGNATFHRLEEIRTKLVDEGIPEINNLMSQHLELDRQKLRSLVSKAQKEMNDPEKNSDKKSYKELFKYLKQNLQ